MLKRYNCYMYLPTSFPYHYTISSKQLSSTFHDCEVFYDLFYDPTSKK